MIFLLLHAQLRFVNNFAEAEGVNIVRTKAKGPPTRRGRSRFMSKKDDIFAGGLICLLGQWRSVDDGRLIACR